MCLTYASKATGQTVNSGRWLSRVAGIACARLRLAQWHLCFAATGDACPAKTLPRSNPPADWWQLVHPPQPAAWLRQQCAPSWLSRKWSCRELSALPPTLPSATRPSPDALLRWQLPLQRRAEILVSTGRLAQGYTELMHETPQTLGGIESLHFEETGTEEPGFSRLFKTTQALL